MPDVLCGTHIDPALTRRLGTPTKNWHEYNRVDRQRAITAPCFVLSGSNEVVSVRFSWRAVATDLMYLAKDTGKVSGVTAPRYMDNSLYKTLVGTDGAISQTPCKTKGGNYFTLTLQLPQVKPGDNSHRKDIETFIRAYFPATVKTLGCA
ncbi:hypothetical protein [Streptomyces bungoensis]|uniref:hypothetical protein n=1 Tax=Streptomyces bungoensis TaxID=285568 RepID=UPI00131BD378|nr:hypothetical protein [Streptomyces bungoensis]